MDVTAWLRVAFGEDTALDVAQMAARALVVFFLALGLIRLAGRRSFAQHSPFDACMTVLLGAVLSRAVVGASPFVATAVAATALALLHRAVALASVWWPRFERFVNGPERVLWREGRSAPDAMAWGLVNQRDLDEAVRREVGDRGMEAVDRVILERDGRITVIARGGARG